MLKGKQRDEASVLIWIFPEMCCISEVNCEGQSNYRDSRVECLPGYELREKVRGL